VIEDKDYSYGKLQNKYSEIALVRGGGNLLSMGNAGSRVVHKAIQ
jgi:hypothetical protein